MFFLTIYDGSCIALFSLHKFFLVSFEFFLGSIVVVASCNKITKFFTCQVFEALTFHTRHFE